MNSWEDETSRRASDDEGHMDRKQVRGDRGEDDQQVEFGEHFLRFTR